MNDCGLKLLQNCLLGSSSNSYFFKGSFWILIENPLLIPPRISLEVPSRMLRGISSGIPLRNCSINSFKDIGIYYFSKDPLGSHPRTAPKKI